MFCAFVPTFVYLYLCDYCKTGSIARETKKYFFTNDFFSRIATYCDNLLLPASLPPPAFLLKN